MSVQGFIKNILGIDSEEMVMWGHTVIRAEKFDWKKHAKILPDQKPVEFRLWQSCWSQMALMDIHHYPLWEQGVHDCLQKNFQELSLIFLAYCRSLLGSDSAEDAVEMEMAEFHDFVEECGLETKEVNFDLMSNMFTKVCTCPARARDLPEHVSSRPDEPHVHQGQRDQHGRGLRAAQASRGAKPHPRWAPPPRLARRLDQKTPRTQEGSPGRITLSPRSVQCCCSC